ncbi:etoposide-induced protein 2.4-domain-containing protein, partial [Pilobolus umbonatus]
MTPTLYVSYFTKGIQQAFNWNRVYYLLINSRVVRQTLFKSIALNVFIYLGILILVETFYSTPDHHLFGYAYSDLTGYPLYLICLLFNSQFYAQIAQAQQRYSYQQEQTMATSVYTIILYANCAVFIFILRRIPVIGSIAAFLLYCIFMSYYCFDYKWKNQDWTIEQRMAYTEQHWAYYLGFGFPAATLTFFLSSLRSNAVFAVLYPCYIIMTSNATPLPVISQTTRNHYIVSHTDSSMADSSPLILPVFIVVRKMNQCILSIAYLLGGSKAEAFLSEKSDHLYYD